MVIINLAPEVFWVLFKMAASQLLKNLEFEKYPEDPGNEVVVGLSCLIDWSSTPDKREFQSQRKSRKNRFQKILAFGLVFKIVTMFWTSFLDVF